MGTIREAGFILAGNYPEENPAAGLEEVLQLFEWGEQLGYDTAGIRQRHLEHGVSSSVAFLAAASQRTRSITLESDVFPLGYESPFRAAEDLATVFALAKGRLNIGFSVSTVHEELLEQFSLGVIDKSEDRYVPATQFLQALRSEPLATEAMDTPAGPQIPRIQPYIPKILDHVWYGGGSDASIIWAAERGLSLLLGNLTTASGGIENFREARLAQIDLYRQTFVGKPQNKRLGVERVIVALDGADQATREAYLAYKESRVARTRSPQGPRRMLIERDLIGFADEIVEDLLNDPVFDGETKLRISLPFHFTREEFRQNLQDIAEKVLPQVGWAPRAHERIQATFG